jgi:serine/threonine protein kinase
MSGNGRHFDEDALGAWMAAYDEARAKGLAPPPDLPGDVPELGEARDCLDLLNARWPHARTPPDGLPPIGRFRIVRSLGRGGCGVVLLAFDPILQREVALKLPRPEALFDDDQRRRFLREARAAAGLQHPNIVPVFEAAEAGAVCWIASAYCPGGSLAEWLRGRGEPVPVRTAAELVAVLAGATHYLHECGLVHRDLKPSNILLEVQEKGDTPGASSEHAVSLGPSRLVPRVTDFGLARLLEAVPDHTRTGAVLGTPHYMAPEQAEGRNLEVGRPTDVYALGCILYELLTGQTPFRGASDTDTLRLLLDTEPEVPSRLRRDVPRDLETICLKCLEKLTGRRYASAAALDEDLRRFLEGKPINARPVGRLEHGWRWCRRKPVAAALVATAAALVLSVISGFSASTVLWRRAVAGEAQALQNLGKEQVARQEAEDHFKMLRELLTNNVRDRGIGFDRNLDPDPLPDALLLDADVCLTHLLRQRSEDQELRGLLAEVLTRLGTRRSPDESLHYYERAVDLWSHLPPAWARKPKYLAARAGTYGVLGTAYMHQGHADRALQAYETCFGLWKELAEGNPNPDNQEGLLNAAMDLAAALIDDGRSEEEVLHRFEGLRSRHELLGQGQASEALFDFMPALRLYSTAARKNQEKEPAAGLATARETASILVRYYGQPSIERSHRMWLANLTAMVCKQLRDGEAAEEAFRLAELVNRSLQKHVSTTQGDHRLFVELSASWEQIGKAQGQLGKVQETLDAYRLALEAQRQACTLAPRVAEYRQTLGERFLQLGRRLCEAGRLEEATACFQGRQALWPGDASKHAEALTKLRKWAVDVRDGKKDLSAAEQQERQRYLDLCARLEQSGADAAPASGGTKP